MLQLLTTDDFAGWFKGLDDGVAEDVATSLEVVAQLGPVEAAPGSRESLLWYEHPSVSRFLRGGSLAGDLEEWGCFHDYVKQVLARLETPSFVSRLARLGKTEAAEALKYIKEMKRAADPRMRWTLKFNEARRGADGRAHLEEARVEVRRLYLAVLGAAGFDIGDVPAHSLALRELSRRAPAPAFRLLYGVDVKHERALFVLGEWLDRCFYGDSVRRAEGAWKQFLEGTLRSVEPAQVRSASQEPAP